MAFPNISDAITTLLYASRIKSYILSIADCYENSDPDKEKLANLQSEYNWFLIKDGATNFRQNDTQNKLSGIDREFSALCSMMEANNSYNPKAYTPFEFYGKISYLQFQIAQQNGQQ